MVAQYFANLALHAPFWTVFGSFDPININDSWKGTIGCKNTLFELLAFKSPPKMWPTDAMKNGIDRQRWMDGYVNNHNEMHFSRTRRAVTAQSGHTNCYWRQRFRCLLGCHLELATYRSASLVTVCGDVCLTPESLLVSSPELAQYCLFCAISMYSLLWLLFSSFSSNLVHWLPGWYAWLSYDWQFGDNIFSEQDKM